MTSYTHVDAQAAGPLALGILVPPAKRTFVILRPRALAVDLVLCRALEDHRFADFAHDEASAAAQGLWRELRQWDGRSGLNLVAGHACLQLGPFTLVACRRHPGQPYSPLEARPADLIALEEALGPDLGNQISREVYFNMRYFERS
ncbi:MAG: hypothetical protein SNJ82_05080 [Gemmataceae bacterium]